MRAAAAQAGSSGMMELEIELVKKENENEKLKSHIELKNAAVTRSRASLAEDAIVITYVVEIPQKKTHVSPLRRPIQRIRDLFSQEEKQEELHAEVTISSETNPYYAHDSDYLSHRSIVAEPSAPISTQGVLLPSADAISLATWQPLYDSPGKSFTRLDRKGASPEDTLTKRHM